MEELMRVFKKLPVALLCALLVATPAVTVIADGINGSGIIKKRA
jgi:hypothetical protein